MSSRFVLLLLSLSAFAPRAQAREIKFGLETYFAAQARSPANSAINPSNAVLHIPDSAVDADLRPELKYLDDVNKIIIRPRFTFDATTWTEGAPSVKKQNSEGHLNLTDAYLETRFTETAKLNAGLEVYQWGPAELYNASNPLFHLSTIGRSAFFKEKGQMLLRLSLDSSAQWSNMLILNPVSNNEPEWQADGQFNAGGFLKSELRNAGGDSSIGALAGSQPDGRRFFGEYGTYAFASGFSLYADARHPVGTRRYLPLSASGGNLETLQTSDRLATLALAGLRWEGRVDARVEYFYNSDGLTAAEFKSSLDSLRALSAYIPINLARFLQPGLEIYGQHYLYLSVRVPELGRAKDSSFSARLLTAVQDGSTLAQVSYEKPWNDSVVLLLEGDATFGQENQELTMFDRTAAFTGLKWTL
jgi:hypothetical protein